MSIISIIGAFSCVAEARRAAFFIGSGQGRPHKTFAGKVMISWGGRSKLHNLPSHVSSLLSFSLALSLSLCLSCPLPLFLSLSPSPSLSLSLSLSLFVPLSLSLSLSLFLAQVQALDYASPRGPVLYPMHDIAVSAQDAQVSMDCAGSRVRILFSLFCTLSEGFIREVKTGALTAAAGSEVECDGGLICWYFGGAWCDVCVPLCVCVCVSETSLSFSVVGWEVTCTLSPAPTAATEARRTGTPKIPAHKHHAADARR